MNIFTYILDSSGSLIFQQIQRGKSKSLVTINFDRYALSMSKIVNNKDKERHS